MDTARPWPSRPPEVAVLALFSIFLISTDSYYIHAIKDWIRIKERHCVKESQCCYLQHLGSVCIWGILWLTSGDWPSFRPLDLLGLLWGPGWRSFNRVVKTRHGIWQRKEHIRVDTRHGKQVYPSVYSMCMHDGLYAHCVRPLLSVVELGLVWAWNSEAKSTLFMAWSCMWVSGRMGSKRALTLFFKQRESKHIVIHKTEKW